MICSRADSVAACSLPRLRGDKHHVVPCSCRVTSHNPPLIRRLSLSTMWSCKCIITNRLFSCSGIIDLCANIFQSVIFSLIHARPLVAELFSFNRVSYADKEETKTEEKRIFFLWSRPLCSHKKHLFSFCVCDC